MLQVQAEEEQRGQGGEHEEEPAGAGMEFLAEDGDECAVGEIGRIFEPVPHLAGQVRVAGREKEGDVGQPGNACDRTRPEHTQQPHACQHEVAQAFHRDGPQGAVHQMLERVVLEDAGQVGIILDQQQVAKIAERFRMGQEIPGRQRGEDDAEQEHIAEHRDQHPGPDPQEALEEKRHDLRLPQPAPGDQIAADREEGHHRHSAHHVGVQPGGRCCACDMEVMAEDHGARRGDAQEVEQVAPVRCGHGRWFLCRPFPGHIVGDEGAASRPGPISL